MYKWSILSSDYCGVRCWKRSNMRKHKRVYHEEVLGNFQVNQSLKKHQTECNNNPTWPAWAAWTPSSPSSPCSWQRPGQASCSPAPANKFAKLQSYRKIKLTLLSLIMFFISPSRKLKISNENDNLWVWAQFTSGEEESFPGWWTVYILSQENQVWKVDFKI